MIDRETVIQWALEGGLPPTHAARISDVLEYVAQRAAEAERQACEKECFKLIDISSRNAVDGDHFEIGREAGHSECIDAIRARGIRSKHENRS